jgi:hypothetical protein
VPDQKIVTTKIASQISANTNGEYTRYHFDGTMPA